MCEREQLGRDLLAGVLLGGRDGCVLGPGHERGDREKTGKENP